MTSHAASQSPARSRGAAGVWLGVLAVALVAIATAWVVLVKEPVAAVEGLPYADVLAGVEEAGLSLAGEGALLAVWGGLATLGAVAAATLVSLRRISAAAGRRVILALLGANAGALVLGGFSASMDVADAFGVAGGSATWWPLALLAVSALAVVALVVDVVRPRGAAPAGT
ncbi:hypothetical protein [Demequina litorisediminis]|uniref:Tryptophan-associated transmembrane protein (Trp_oprn_chp) n=1 Tax=Demequina litorisediminis TaxID=1849022 RepID=A0ABQ6IHX0_9MICO|nr:hypothetical protein [Demequina litorisediminis]GMA36314.1 hypothetical protein GCM10025876_25180 [Demequina litorisediminis]